MSCSFRQAVPADRARILEIYEHIFIAEEQGPRVCGWTRQFYPTPQVADDGIASGEMVVLEDDGLVVGSARFNSLQDEIFSKAHWEHAVPANEVLVLHTLAVDPECKGHGYGLQFLQYYEELARKLGCTDLRIDTSGTNTRARRIYAEAGFSEVDSHRYAFRAGEPVHEVIFLEKYIAPTQDQSS